jgi:phosphoglycolate phosphatase
MDTQSSSSSSPSAVPIGLACIDMAGTVMNDNGIVLEAFRQALQAAALEGAEFDAAINYAHETMGLPKSVVFKHLLGADQRVDEAMAAFASAIDEAIKGGLVTEIPGAREAMSQLRAKHVKICLTTGFSAEVQVAIIDHLGWREITDFFLAPSSELRGRPYPDMVLAAALRAGVDDVREVAVAGDTANDLWTGWRAGASLVAGVLTGSHDRGELEAAPHTHILRSIVEFPPLVAAD